jgi:hypothetical protein
LSLGRSPALDRAHASERDAARGVGKLALAEAAPLARLADRASEFRQLPRIRALRIVVHRGLLALGAGDQSRTHGRSQATMPA